MGKGRWVHARPFNLPLLQIVMANVQSLTSEMETLDVKWRKSSGRLASSSWARPGWLTLFLMKRLAWSMITRQGPSEDENTQRVHLQNEHFYTRRPHLNHLNNFCARFDSLHCEWEIAWEPTKPRLVTLCPLHKSGRLLSAHEVQSWQDPPVRMSSQAGS